uniref:Putative transporter n=1 Tax=Aegilops tauschii TaxID=37682 RepID=R7W262_AEGTA
MWRRILFASKKTRSIMILNALTVIYASDIPVLKEVEALTEPAVFNMVRFVIAAIPFIPFVIRAFGDRRTRNGGLELGVWVSLAYLAQAIGLITSEAGRASFIAAFTVIVVPLIDGIFGASIPMLTWFGAIVSVIGVGLLECGGSPPCVGDVLNFLSAVFFGIHMLRTEQISRSTDKKKFMALLSFEMPSLRSTIPALNHGRLMVAMAHVSATETAIVYGLEPVWGATFAWFLLGERWDNAAWIGAALVLCGSLTVQLFGSAPEKSQKVESRSGNTFESPLKRQERLSLSAIPVDSRKNIGSQLESSRCKVATAVGNIVCRFHVNIFNIRSKDDRQFHITLNKHLSGCLDLGFAFFPLGFGGARVPHLPPAIYRRSPRRTCSMAGVPATGSQPIPAGSNPAECMKDLPQDRAALEDERRMAGFRSEDQPGNERSDLSGAEEDEDGVREGDEQDGEEEEEEGGTMDPK